MTMAAISLVKFAQSNLIKVHRNETRKAKCLREGEIMKLIEIDKNEFIQRFHKQQYINGNIDVYELADKLNIPYDEIGVYLISSGLKQKKEIEAGTLYSIKCPSCGKGWIIPYMLFFTCDCNTDIAITF